MVKKTNNIVLGLCCLLAGILIVYLVNKRGSLLEGFGDFVIPMSYAEMSVSAQKGSAPTEKQYIQTCPQGYEEKWTIIPSGNS